jgi:hypothetical protein
MQGTRALSVLVRNVTGRCTSFASSSSSASATLKAFRMYSRKKVL